MTVLSTAAWCVHDLGLTAGVGGSLFGQLALHPAVQEISDDGERARVVQQAWRRFSVLQLAGFSAVALTWFTGRAALSGREVGPNASTSRGLVVAKDVLVGATVAAAVATSLTGRALGRQTEDGDVPMTPDGEVAPEAPAQARRLQAAVDALGTATLLCGIAVQAVTTVLAMRAGQSGRWSLISRLLK